MEEFFMIQNPYGEFLSFDDFVWRGYNNAAEFDTEEEALKFAENYLTPFESFTVVKFYRFGEDLVEDYYANKIEI